MLWSPNGVLMNEWVHYITVYIYMLFVAIVIWGEGENWPLGGFSRIPTPCVIFWGVQSLLMG